MDNSILFLGVGAGGVFGGRAGGYLCLPEVAPLIHELQNRCNYVRVAHMRLILTAFQFILVTRFLYQTLQFCS